MDLLLVVFSKTDILLVIFPKTDLLLVFYFSKADFLLVFFFFKVDFLLVFFRPMGINMYFGVLKWTFFLKRVLLIWLAEPKRTFCSFRSPKLTFCSSIFPNWTFLLMESVNRNGTRHHCPSRAVGVYELSVGQSCTYEILISRGLTNRTSACILPFFKQVRYNANVNLGAQNEFLPFR